MFVMLLDGKIKEDSSITNVLTYISSGVISGFLGFKLLKRVAENFDSTVRVARQTASKVVDERLEEEHRRNRLFRAIIEGMVAQKENIAPTAVDEAIKNLDEALANYPDNRRAAIVLGELYAKKRRDYKKALEVIMKAKSKMQSNKTGEPKDIADIHYNCACYYCLMHFVEADDEEKIKLKKLAFDNLNESLRIWPQNAADALSDEDFRSFATDTEFTGLLSRFQDPPSQGEAQSATP